MSGWNKMKPEEQTAALDECPFCHAGDTAFLKSKDHKHLMVVHYPPKGVNCPARFEQACDSQEQGARWWNDRTPKGGEDKEEKK